MTETTTAPPATKPVSAQMFTIAPGEKVIFLDQRLFKGDPVQQQAWETVLSIAFRDAKIAPEWALRWAFLPAMGTLVAVGITPENGKSYRAIAFAREFWDASELRQAIADGTLFKPGNDLDTILAEDPREIILAYQDDPHLYPTILSLHRDYGAFPYPIGAWAGYATLLAWAAKRWDHVPTDKAAPPKRDITLRQAQVYALGRFFTVAIAEQLIDRFHTVEAALAPLKTVTFTEGGNPRLPAEYKGIEGLATGRLLKAWQIYMRDHQPAPKPIPEPKVTVPEMSI